MRRRKKRLLKEIELQENNETEVRKETGGYDMSPISAPAPKLSEGDNKRPTQGLDEDGDDDKQEIEVDIQEDMYATNPQQDTTTGGFSGN